MGQEHPPNPLGLTSHHNYPQDTSLINHGEATSTGPQQNFPKRPPDWLGNITGSLLSPPPRLALGGPRDCSRTGQSCLGFSDSGAPPFKAKSLWDHGQHLRLMAEVEMLPGTSSAGLGLWLLPSPAHQPLCLQSHLILSVLTVTPSIPCLHPSVAPTALRKTSRVLTLAFEALASPLASPLYPAHQILDPLEMPSHAHPAPSPRLHSPFSNLHSKPASSRNHALPHPSPSNLSHLARGLLPPLRPGIFYCPASSAFQDTAFPHWKRNVLSSFLKKMC